MGHQGLFLAGAPGGCPCLCRFCRSSCPASLPACGLSCPPAKNRPSAGLELGFGRPSLLPSVWGFYYIACLRTLSSGEQRAKIFIPFARLLPIFCNPFAILLPIVCRRREQAGRLQSFERTKKHGLFWVVLSCFISPC